MINLRDDELRIYDGARPERCNRFSGALVSGAYGGFFVIDTAFDQSHLIRDFLMFSGFSPEDYLRRQNYLRQNGVHIKRNHLPLAD